jgi:type I restriction enzyme M protein
LSFATLGPTGPTRDIWFYEQPLPEGRKKYAKTQPLQYEEFSDCLAWWNNRHEGPQAWKVRAADLIQRDEQGRVTAVNLDQKNPHAKEAIDHRPPVEIVESIIGKEREVLVILDEIRALVAQGVAA